MNTSFQASISNLFSTVVKRDILLKREVTFVMCGVFVKI